MYSFNVKLPFLMVAYSIGHDFVRDLSLVQTNSEDI